MNGRRNYVLTATVISTDRCAIGSNVHCACVWNWKHLHDYIRRALTTALVCVCIYIYQTHTHTPSFTSEWQLIEIDWDSIEPGRERRRRRRRISKRGWKGMCTSCAAINIVQRSMRQSMEMQPVDSHRQAPYYSLELHFFVYVYTKRYASSGLSILLHWARLVIVCTIPTSSFRPLYWLIPIANER